MGIQQTQYKKGFTIVELLIVIVVIAILATISIVAYNGVQSRARDSERITKVKAIGRAIEMYYVDNGYYPMIQHGSGNESSCGSQTENWGHCDRLKLLSDALAPYITIEPESMSRATQGDYYYNYASQVNDGWQSYGMMVQLEGDGGANDGGFYANRYEVGNNPAYCQATYSNNDADWFSKPTNWGNRCEGGN